MLPPVFTFFFWRKNADSNYEGFLWPQPGQRCRTLEETMSHFLGQKAITTFSTISLGARLLAPSASIGGKELRLIGCGVGHPQRACRHGYRGRDPDDSHCQCPTTVVAYWARSWRRSSFSLPKVTATGAGESHLCRRASHLDPPGFGGFSPGGHSCSKTRQRG